MSEEPTDVILEEERGHADAGGLSEVRALGQAAIEMAQPACLGKG
ncbi:MAG TPA: hypothetical protein VHV31_13540 [Nitrolancea sp.]|nr:hypothetical protein [Nitrolancea sp.]